MPSVKENIKRSIEKGNKLNSRDYDNFKSTNNLPFEMATYITPDFTAFRVGTCHGLFGFDGKSYAILAVQNENQGNGHLNDVFEWFENSCKRDKKNLMVLELWNDDFKKHLINKRGFVVYPDNNEHLIKYLNDIK
jgi:hypothetical protein